MAEHLREAEERTLDEEDLAFIAKAMDDALKDDALNKAFIEGAKRQAEERGRQAASTLCLVFGIATLMFAVFVYVELRDVGDRVQDLTRQINQSVAAIDSQVASPNKAE